MSTTSCWTWATPSGSFRETQGRRRRSSVPEISTPCPTWFPRHSPTGPTPDATSVDPSPPSQDPGGLSSRLLLTRGVTDQTLMLRAPFVLK